MEIVNCHILHQAEVFCVTVIIAWGSALQGCFIGQIGRIADRPEEDRLLLLKINELSTSGHKPCRSWCCRGYPGGIFLGLGGGNGEAGKRGKNCTEKQNEKYSTRHIRVGEKGRVMALVFRCSSQPEKPFRILYCLSALP